MERFAWKGRIKPGMQEEYKRRHDEIWPEMLELLKSAGIRNYTIWSDGRDVFGYYECEKGIEARSSTNGTIIWKTCWIWRWIRKPAPSPSSG